MQRADDNEETIGKRLKVYTDQTAPLVDFYRDAGLLKTVAGDGEMDDVYGRIESIKTSHDDRLNKILDIYDQALSILL